MFPARRGSLRTSASFLLLSTFSVSKYLQRGNLSRRNETVHRPLKTVIPDLLSPRGLKEGVVHKVLLFREVQESDQTCEWVMLLFCSSHLQHWGPSLSSAYEWGQRTKLSRMGLVSRVRRLGKVKIEPCPHLQLCPRRGRWSWRRLLIPYSPSIPPFKMCIVVIITISMVHKKNIFTLMLVHN